MCHVQQTKEYDSDGSHTEQMSAFNSAESHTACVRVRWKTIAEIMSKISDDLRTMKNVMGEKGMELLNA